MKYKVIQNNAVIAVLDGVTYCKQQRNGVVVPCSKEKTPCGIISEEGTVWHLEGLPEFTQSEYNTVRIAEITDTEYEELKAALSIDEEIAEPEQPPEDSPGDSAEEEEGAGQEATQGDSGEETEENDDSGIEVVPEKEPVMTVAQMRQEIIALKEQVATLTAVNNALTEYHIKASDSSINSIAKIRGVSSDTANEVSEITSTQEVESNAE